VEGEGHEAKIYHEFLTAARDLQRYHSADEKKLTGDHAGQRHRLLQHLDSETCFLVHLEGVVDGAQEPKGSASDHQSEGLRQFQERLLLVIHSLIGLPSWTQKCESAIRQ